MKTRSTLEKLLRAYEIQQQTGQLDAALDLTTQALKLEPGSESANRRKTEIAMAKVRRYNGFSSLGLEKEMKPLLQILYAGSSMWRVEKRRCDSGHQWQTAIYVRSTGGLAC